MGFTEYFLVTVSIVIFFIYLVRRYSTKKQKVNKHQETLFLEMMKKKFPEFTDKLNPESVALFLHEWQQRRHDSKVLSYTRMIKGVERGKYILFGGFQSSLDEGYAASYVLSECGKFISDDFSNYFLEHHCVDDFYAIQDMIVKSMKVAHNL